MAVLDRLGKELEISDRVRLANLEMEDPPKYPIGTRGVVICIESDNEIGVRFDSPDERGHNLGHKIPDNRGWWIEPKLLEKIPSSEKSSGDPYKDFSDVLDGKRRYIVLDSGVYELAQLDRIHSASDILEHRDRESAQLLRDQIDILKRREEELIAESKKRLLMPDVDAEHVIKGLHVFKESGYIVYVCPLRYAPKFVLREKTTFKIDDRDQQKMARDVFLMIKPNNAGAVSYMDVVDSDGRRFTQFQHYHQGCFGTLEMPRVSKVGDVLRIRDQTQSMLETINANSKANDTPKDMPVFRDFFDRCTLLGDPGKAGVMKRDTFGTPEIYVGDRVMVIKVVDKFPADKISSVGKVVSSTENSKEELIIGVEFTFKHEQFHDARGAGKDKHCYYFPVDYLMPIDADGEPVKDRPNVEDRKLSTTLKADRGGVFRV